jgi:hypothetical protein
MSLKDGRSYEKNKKPFDPHSKKHEEKSAQSISSLSSHIGQLEKRNDKLMKELKISLRN